MIPSSSPSGGEILNNLTGFFEQMITNKAVLSVFLKIMSFGPKILEPKHYGKFIDKQK
jgi:hypothetical protein